jgi:hypothetical protein
MSVGIMASAVVISSVLPSDISNLYGWWDASVGPFTYATAPKISQWNDRSGNNRHASQATASAQPSVSGTQNGLSTLTFTAANSQFMSTTSFTLVQPYTIIVAGNMTAAADSAYVYATPGGGADGPFIYLTGGSLHFYAGTDLVTTGPTSGVHTLVGVFNTTASGFWSDGTSVSTANPGSGRPVQGLGIGRTSTRWLNGALFEMCLWNRALTTLERQQMEAYFRAKWATP